MPRPLRSIELFLALGAATTSIGALPAGATTAATGTHQAMTSHLVAQHGGHGGAAPFPAPPEGGKGERAAKDPR